jgi:hypothetical protein
MVILVENKNKFTLLAVFAVLMLFVAFSGCIGGAVENKTTQSNSTKTNQTITGQTNVSQTNTTTSTNQSGNSTIPPIKTNESTMTNTSWTNTSDNKTGVEKIEQAVAQAIADGTYIDQVEYAYHSGTERVTITVKTEKDIVTQATVVPAGQSSSGVSTRIIGKFNDALPNLVVGKKITELNIPKNVAGSTLTTAAFKSYVARIVEQN